jgi:hypothetical protein
MMGIIPSAGTNDAPAQPGQAAREGKGDSPFAACLQGRPGPEKTKKAAATQNPDVLMASFMHLLASASLHSAQSQPSLQPETGETPASLRSVFSSGLPNLQDTGGHNGGGEAETSRSKAFALLQNYDLRSRNLTVEGGQGIQSLQSSGRFMIEAPKESPQDNGGPTVPEAVKEGVKQGMKRVDTRIVAPLPPTFATPSGDSARVVLGALENPPVGGQSLPVHGLTPDKQNSSDTHDLQAALSSGEGRMDGGTSAEGPSVPQTPPMDGTQANALFFWSNGREQIAAPSASPMGVESVNATRFVPEFTDHLVKRAELVQQDGISTYKVTLMPEGLGEIHVQVSKSADTQLTVLLSADTPEAKHLLDTHLSALRTHLEQQGLQVHEARVLSSAPFHPSADSGLFQQNGQGGRWTGSTVREGGKARTVLDSEYEKLEEVRPVPLTSGSGIDYIA